MPEANGAELAEAAEPESEPLLADQSAESTPVAPTSVSFNAKVAARPTYSVVPAR